jgi:chemosensory pili system protein ChpA (sensor histidine kinase/response regulator)
MDSLRNSETADGLGADIAITSDLSALSWVHDELRRSVELALKALRRHVRELESGVDFIQGLSGSTHLQTVQHHLHQTAGALEMTGMGACARLAAACEAAAERFMSQPSGCDPQAAEVIESALFALLDFIERVMAGRSVSPLAMFPQYQAVQQLAGAERVHPADLWEFEWCWLELPDDKLAAPRAPDAATRAAAESKMLSLMRGPTAAAAARMSDIFAGLGAGAKDPRAATLWKLAAALFQAQSQDLLAPDVFSKRVVSRLLTLLRAFESGNGEVSELLARDLLFFCAQAKAPATERSAPRLSAVLEAYGLTPNAGIDYRTSALGRFDPALIAQALKRIAAAKELWSGVADGGSHRQQGLLEPFGLVGESLKRLFPFGQSFADALQQVALQAQQSDAPPAPALAMEVATSLLYVEACIEDAQFDHPELGARAQRLSQRIASVSQGGQPEPLEDWMEALYRRVSDRQTMGGVVRELRASLSEAEHLIDAFFRNPADAQMLISVPHKLSSMRGALSVLGMSHAAAAVLRMCEEIDGLTSTEIDLQRVAEAGVFDRLANNLGALGFLIDMLAVQPALCKTLFVYDAEAGTLSPVMGRSERGATVSVAPQAPAKRPVAPPAPVSAVPSAVAASVEDVAIDPEMRDVFLEEAREVCGTAREACAELAEALADPYRLTLVRRCFHTLKGSARMVGLSEFADAAWACEGVYNARLAAQRPADVPLLEFTRGSLDRLEAWVDDIAAGRAPAHGFAAIREAVRQLLEGADKPMSEQPSPAMVELRDTEPMELQPAPSVEGPEFDLDLSLPAAEVQAVPQPTVTEADSSTVDFGSMFGPMGFELTRPMASPEPAPQPSAPPQPSPSSPFELLDLDLDASAPDDDQYKLIGPLRISISLFNIYLNEADELSRRLGIELAEWSLELDRSVGEDAVALSHSLAGSSATVGFGELSELSRTLEHAMSRNCTMGFGTPQEAALFNDAADEIRGLLHQFAAGFLKSPSEELLRRLAEHEITSAQRLESTLAMRDTHALLSDDAPRLETVDEVEPALEVASAEPAVAPPAVVEPSVPELLAQDEADATDAVQPELFAIFEEEADELFDKLESHLQGWSRAPADAEQPAGAMRDLHTLKGAARLAGAMRLGEMLHGLESRIEDLASPLAEAPVVRADIEPLLARCDSLRQVFETLRGEVAQQGSSSMAPTAPLVPVEAAEPPRPAAQEIEPTPLADIDWSAFAGDGMSAESPAMAVIAPSTSAVRVRAPLLDRLVNQAGEVSITRSRIASDVNQMKDALGDLSDNLDRLRGQLHEIEIQADTQISSRMEAARAASEEFDPLEFDRYTRLQELTRMLAESVNDVATVQRTLQKSLQSAEDELAAQGRLTRELQDDLLRTRMVEFEGLAERLQRVVRQAAKETGKQVRLDIEGGAIEVDRGVLDRMTGAFEHLLRNSVTHGIELPSVRTAAGKDSTGRVVVAVSQSGNEVSVEVRDDGQGLDLPRIRDKARAGGLIAEGQSPSDGELAELIYRPGFSTVDKVTELAGRGIGMDVVRSEVSAIGGRIETATHAGHGASFKLMLPLTTAITQVVMVRCGSLNLGVPSTLVETVCWLSADEVDAACLSGSFSLDGQKLPFFWMGALLQTSDFSAQPIARQCPVLIARSASQRIAVQVDEVVANQEVVVKNLGPQLSRMPGLAGMTLLASGEVALIYNPVALATLYGAGARSATLAAMRESEAADGALRAAVIEQPLAPLVLVVDDSLTVRRVTERMLLREGYRVMLAKDGLDALEHLALERPAVVLSDIEMPRMDGFEFVRKLRADPDLLDLPVIMITSRIAQKHRDHAAQLGVEHYLGKPYSEEKLLALITQCMSQQTEAQGA